MVGEYEDLEESVSGRVVRIDVGLWCSCFIGLVRL